MPGACDKMADEQLMTSRPRSPGLEHSPTTCYHRSRYPSGCLVLECRLEAGRPPVARVVQVPAGDIATKERKSYLLVETRSPSDPSSRVISSRPEDDAKRQVGSIRVYPRERMADEFVLVPASRALKFPDRVDDYAILADQAPIPSMKTDSTAILKTDRKAEQLEDSIARTKSYFLSLPEQALQASYRRDEPRNEPVPTIIECAATSRGPAARIIQTTDAAIRISCAKRDTSCRETFLQRDDPCSIDTRRSPGKCSSSSYPCNVLEITVDRRRSGIDKIAQRAKISDGRCVSSGKRKAVPCRNGLDTVEVPPVAFEKPLKRRVCPARCCQPRRRSTIKEIRDDFSTSGRCIVVIRSDDDDQRRLRRPASERRLRAEVARLESTKSDKASACRRSATASGHARLIPGKISVDISRSCDSREPLTRPAECIPWYRLRRYEACRSRRNGLQDECVPPRAAKLMKGEEPRVLRGCDEQDDVDGDSSRGEISESMCAKRDRTEVSLHLG